MTKALQLAIAASALCGAGAVWYFAHGSSRSGVVPANLPSAEAGQAAAGVAGGEGRLVSLGDVLRARCESDGVTLDEIPVRKIPPRVPESFADDAQGSWSKAIRKLEARHGFVPIYDKADPVLNSVPARITQVGAYLYFGRDAAKINALKMLADGGVDERSAALDRFADDSMNAEPLFLSLLKSDSDPQIRTEAAQRLQSLPSERAIGALLQALGDSDEAVQSAARAALVWIGDGQVLKAVRVAANSPNKKIAGIAASILEDNLERR